MANEVDRPKTKEELIQQLINETQILVRRDGESFSGRPPFRMAGYNVGADKFLPVDYILEPRFSGPIKGIRVLLSEREDGSVQIQAYAQFPSETRVISLVLSEKGAAKLLEYKVFDPKAPMPYTTPMPILEEITKDTLQSFMDLVGRIKPNRG